MGAACGAGEVKSPEIGTIDSPMGKPVSPVLLKPEEPKPVPMTNDEGPKGQIDEQQRVDVPTEADSASL